MDGDYNDLRVHEVLIDPATGAVTALRVEVTWGSRSGDDEPRIWDRSVVTLAAVGPLASAEVGDRLELRGAPEGPNPEGRDARAGRGGRSGPGPRRSAGP